MLDRSIKKAFEKADPSRPVVAHSGVLPHLPQLDGTDGHLYFGWYWGDERDFPGFVAGLPKMARFLTEFGAQAVPNSAEFVDPDRWPELDWEHLEARHAYQPTFHDRYVPREGLDFDGWRLASQRYQADVARFHIETIRRLKYRPAGGFAHFSFADSMPSITWAVLGHDRSPKLAYQALKAACAPVIIVVDRPPAQVRPGERLALDVHVVSDLRTPIEAAKVHVTVAWDGGSLDWTFGGDVEADSVVKVGGLDFAAPEVSGPVLITPPPRGRARRRSRRPTTSPWSPDRRNRRTQPRSPLLSGQLLPEGQQGSGWLVDHPSSTSRHHALSFVSSEAQLQYAASQRRAGS